jgi:hypothetical protein
MWEKRRKFKHATDLRLALLAWLLQERMLDFRQVRSILCGDVVEPWLRSHAMFGVERNVFGDASYEALLNTLLSSQHTDVAISAAYLLVREGLPIRRKVREINYVAARGLRSLGLVRGRTKKPSLIAASLSSFLPRDLPTFDWRVALRGIHASVERQAILSAAYAKTDMNALVNALDVLNDRLLDALARHDGTIGSYQLGNIGSLLGSRTSAFATRYPDFFESCGEVHVLRRKSDLSHAIVRGSGKATGRIRFGRLPRLRWTLFHGYTEFIRKW